MLKQALAGIDKRAIRQRIERRSETDFVPGQLEELPDTDEPLAETTFEHFRAGDVGGGGGAVGVGVVDVFGDDATVEDCGVEEHGREGFAEFVPGDERPEQPVDEKCGDDADDEGEAARPGEGRDRGVSFVRVCTEGYDSEAEAADDAGAGMGALAKSMQHWDHVERSEDS